MKTKNLISIVVAIPTLALSCGDYRRGGADNRRDHSVLTSLNGIETAPAGVGELEYELRCDAAMADEKLPGIPGTRQTAESATTVIEFKRTATQPLAAGSSCKLAVVGPVNKEKYVYLDKPKDVDGKIAYYYTTSIGKITASGGLKLIAVKRFNETGARLFDVTISVANTDLSLAIDAKAQLSCSGSEPIAANMGATTGQFVFTFTNNHFQSAETVTCTEFTVSSGTKTFTAKNKLDLIDLSKRSGSRTLSVTIEEKLPEGTPTGVVTVELSDELNNVFDGTCHEATPGVTGVLTYAIDSWDFQITTGANSGIAKRTTALYVDKDCKLAISGAAPATTSYALDILNPSLVVLPNTLPVTFARIEGANKIVETHTIISVEDGVLKFGVPSDGSDTWSGSIDIAKLPTTLSTARFTKRQN